MNSISLPEISVLMSVYNSEEFLKEAIESILDQTFKNFEFIIIDDGSTDNSLKIISNFNDIRIVFVKNEKNLGLAKSLNKGIKLAKGKYIARMDADDISLPFRLERQFTFMNSNQKVDICGSWVKIIGSSKKIIWKYPVENDEIKTQLLFNSAFVHPSVFFKKDTFIEYNLFYDESVKRAQDYELWSRVSEVCNMSNIADVLLHYRLHENQAGRQYQRGQLDTAKRVREKMLSKLGIHASNEEYTIHEELSYFKNVDCRIASNWLVKLIQTNNKIKFCKNDIFEKSLTERYWGSYANNLKKSDCSFRDFLGTPLKEYIKKPYKAYIKLYFKSIIQGKI